MTSTSTPSPPKRPGSARRLTSWPNPWSSSPRIPTRPCCRLESERSDVADLTLSVYDHTPMHAIAVLGPICTVLSVSLVWPQVIKVYRAGTVAGLSSNGTLHGLAACTLWTMYGAARGVGPLIVSNGAIGVALLLIAAA